MTTLTTTFDCNGTMIAVSTVQQPGELDDQFFLRHQAEVEAAKAKCV